MTTMERAPELWSAPPNTPFLEELIDKTQGQSWRAAIDSGFHCIAVGHEYYPIFKASIPYWEHANHGANYEQIAGNFYIRTEKLQKKWNDFIKNAPTHYQFLKENYHNEK